MSSQTVIPPPARTWRDIPQNVKPTSMSTEGRKRLALSVANTVGAGLILAACAWGVFEIVQIVQSDPTRLTAPVKSEPLRDIVLRTDGVLDKTWVNQTLALKKGVTLMELDLATVQARLTASGQVHTAVVSRTFPDKLSVVLQERTPLVRVGVQLGNAAPQVFLVARDGTVYSGSGYAPELLQSLPFLDGVKLDREGAGFAAIEGMAQVGDLLVTALSNAPQLYRGFQVVSLARFAADGVILVRSADVDEVAFGLRQDFFTQLARLDLILDDVRRRPSAERPQKINLAIGGNQVPVAFLPPAQPVSGAVRASGSASARAAAPSVGSPASAPLFPSQRRSSPSRDL